MGKPCSGSLGRSDHFAADGAVGKGPEEGAGGAAHLRKKPHGLRGACVWALADSIWGQQCSGTGTSSVEFPLFSYFDAAQMPELGVYALLAGLVFMLSILCALPTIFRALDFTRREDRL